MKNLQLIALITATTLFISGCMMSKKEAFKMKDDEAVSIIGIKGDFDGETIGKWGEICDFGFKDEQEKMILNYRRDKDNGYIIIKDKAEKINLTAIGCHSYRVFYNKIRRKEFSNLYFTPKKGYVNYLGTVKFQWLPESFKGGDLLLSGSGYLTEDDGKLVMNLANEIKNTKDYIKKEYPEDFDNLKIRKTNFNDNDYFTK